MPSSRYLRAAIALLLPLPLLSQTPTITTTTTLVMVPTLVRAPANASVPTLQASDFTLTDNGVPQKITLENTEHQPLSILVVLQTGGAAIEEFPAYAKLSTMLDNLTANSPSDVSLLTFDSQPEDLYDFAHGVAGLEDSLAKPDPGDNGAAILDAVNAGIDALRQQPPSHRRILVLISQVHDEGSRTRAAEITQRLGENNITIECLAFSPEKTWLKDQFTKPRHENPPYQFSPDMPPLLHTFNLDRPLREALKAMRENTSSTVATLSGGESFSFASRTELEHQLLQLANDFAATYTLSFNPSSKQPGFHALHVTIAQHPEFSISARSSYWATGEASPTK